MSKIGRQRCAAIRIHHRNGRKFPARVFFHHSQAWTFIDDNFSGTDAPQIPGDVLCVGNEGGPADDGRIVHDYRGGRDAAAEMVIVNKNERRVGWTMGKKRARWRHGCPADVASSVTPANPGGRPFNARHPNPAIDGVINPIAIVIAGPGPRIIADPIPAAIRPHPVTVTVGLPIHDDASRPPAATVGAHHYPAAARRQRRVEIGTGVNLHRRGNFQIRLCGQYTQIQQPGCNSQSQKVCRFFHKTSLVGVIWRMLVLLNGLLNKTAFDEPFPPPWVCRFRQPRSNRV